MKMFPTSAFLSLLISGLSMSSYGQSVDAANTSIPTVSIAPVSYRVNDSGSVLHGYYKKGYSLTIYGDSSAIGFRADCDADDDWSGAKRHGTTQRGNSFEPQYHCAFDPNILYGTVLPGSRSGHNHYDGVTRSGADEGDVTITYKVNKDGNVVDSVIGVVFDRGPQNQPGESSVATCKKLKGSTDNNQFIYIVFPGTARYLEKVIGTKANGKGLQRAPTNPDFVQAYQLMCNESQGNTKIAAKNALLSSLSQIPLVANFDNATAKERAAGLLKAHNNDRNLNE
jgi:hypothetical protein